jgi:predicted metal-dependent phosphoesterase TrpH
MKKRAFTILLTIISISNFAIATEWKPYFGLLHSHTSYSDGMSTPDEVYKYAKEAGLDFFAVTDHNHDKAGGSDGTYLTQARYELTRKAAEKQTKNGQFIAICGQEFSTIGAGNHVNIFEASEHCY